MFTPKELSEQLSVSGQISINDVADIAKQGFSTVINNRPDNEEDNQPLSADLERAAKHHGLKYFHLPITGGNISEQDIDTFAKIIAQPGPGLAFCRTGTRCAMLWALSSAKQAKTKDQKIDEIMRIARGAGYDLSHLMSRMRTGAK